jgi:hypothetical protein
MIWYPKNSFKSQQTMMCKRELYKFLIVKQVLNSVRREKLCFEMMSQ